MIRPATILAVLLAVPSVHAGSSRLITAGAAVTEIAGALGLAPQIVAVDTSGHEIEGMGDKPDVGYVRMLGAEGILAQKPDLVLVSGEAGPPPVLEQIKAAGVDVVVIPNGYSLDNIDDKILAIAAATGRVEDGDKLIAQVEADVKLLRTATAGLEGERPGVVFLLARQGGNLTAAGSGTAAHAMIEASGGRNICAAFTGYKPLSAEIFAAATPDFVIVSESVVGDDAQLLASVPGLGSTPAGRALRVIRIDDAAFLGFGPRTPAAAIEVAAALRRP
ncbi:MAG: ABC transporter substrate-binding protein [Chthoniobacterales bacterium]